MTEATNQDSYAAGLGGQNSYDGYTGNFSNPYAGLGHIDARSVAPIFGSGVGTSGPECKFRRTN